MKTVLVLLLIGAIAGAAGWHYYQHNRGSSIGQKAESMAEKPRDAAADTKEAITSKAEDWKLTAENIKEELARTGRVVRFKAKGVGERIDDARIIAIIKGKYVVEKNLSAFAINVDCQDGQVKLTGSVASTELIGRAVTVALETSGVHDVVSQLVVKN